MAIETAEREIVRIPLPKPGDVTLGEIRVDTLSAVVGACIMPAAEDANADHEVDLNGYEVTVTVGDGDLVTDAPLESPIVVGLSESEPPLPFRDRDTDPLILTPREEGVEVAVSLERRRGKKGGKAKKKKTRSVNGKVRDFTRWECWLYIAR